MEPRGDTDLAERERARSGEPSPSQGLLRSRLLIALLLLLGALVWACLRGLHFYGLNPVHLVYDVDQPPWLLLLVSGWLTYRSRPR